MVRREREKFQHSDFSLEILFPIKRNQGLLEKWLALDLGQEMILGYLDISDIKEEIKDN